MTPSILSQTFNELTSLSWAKQEINTSKSETAPVLGTKVTLGLNNSKTEYFKVRLILRQYARCSHWCSRSAVFPMQKKDTGGSTVSIDGDRLMIIRSGYLYICRVAESENRGTMQLLPTARRQRKNFSANTREKISYWSPVRIREGGMPPP